MKKIMLFAAIITALVSCSDNSQAPARTNGYSDVPKTKEDSLMQEVMDGHDVAMAKMGKLAGYRKQTLQKADSLSKSNSAKKGELIQSLHSTAEILQASENEMNAWMEGFSLDSAKEDKAKRIAYLEAEKIKVDRVKTDVLSSIALADSLLKK